MGSDIASQLAVLSRAFLLGSGFALLYDALRAVRLHRRTRRALTDTLDALYSLLLAAALLAFALRVGSGELRLYTLLAVAVGAALTFGFLSPLLRPLWDFWADSLFAFARLLRAPFRLAKNYYGKLHKSAKKLFLFSRRALIIRNYRRSARRGRRRAEQKGGVRYGGAKKGGEKARRSAAEAAHSRPASARRRASAGPSKADRRRAGIEADPLGTGRGPAARE